MIKIYILFLILGVFMHETLHGIAYLTTGIKNKNIKFGIVWKKLTPYTYCSQPIPVWKYWYALILPNLIFLIITILTALAALIYNDVRLDVLFLSSLAILFSGAGDLYVLCKTRHIPKDVYIKDSLTKIGCEIYN